MAWALIAELDANDQLLAAFTQGPGVDDPLIARYNGSDYLYMKNHQGSVLGLATFGGSVVKTYKYDSFGNIKQETGLTVNHGFTYTSRERHSRSGLYYYRARWYSPTLGRLDFSVGSVDSCSNILVFPSFLIFSCG
jgi:hypothetical protein